MSAKIGVWSIESPPQKHNIFVAQDGKSAIMECDGTKIATISMVNEDRVSIHSAGKCNIVVDDKTKQIFIAAAAKD